MVLNKTRVKSMKKLKTSSLRVLIITQGISRIVNPLVSSEHAIVGIVESAPRQKINPSLIQSTYRSLKKFTGELPRFCRRESLAYYYLKKSDDSRFIIWLKHQDPDVIVVHGMAHLIKAEALSIPNLGVINLHQSLLPDYRGPNPTFWQYYNVDLNPGVTLHFIDSGEDTGSIISQDSLRIELGMKCPDLLDELIGNLGVRLILDALSNFGGNTISTKEQPAKLAGPRARNVHPSEHKNIIKWDDWSIERIWHILRGTELWLDAFPAPRGIYIGQRFKVREFVKCATTDYQRGEIYYDGMRHFITCAEGKIFLEVKFNVKASFKGFLRRLIVG